MCGQEDANLVGDGGGSADNGYGSEGSEDGVGTDEGGSEWACLLSPSPDFSVFYLFSMSMKSSGMEDSGTKGISSWEVEACRSSILMSVSSVACELGTCTVVGFSGEGW